MKILHIITGRSGSGKSYFAAQLGAKIFEHDEYFDTRGGCLGQVHREMKEYAQDIAAVIPESKVKIFKASAIGFGYTPKLHVL